MNRAVRRGTITSPLPRLAAALAFSLSAFAAAAEEPFTAQIDRPLVLPAGVSSFTLLGDLTDWANSGLASGSKSISGQSGVVGADFGFGSAQAGVAVALPVHPGFGFGTLVGSVVFSMTPNSGLRLDAAFESVGTNGGSGSSSSSHTARFIGGFGAPVRFQLSPTVAIVSGRTGAAQWTHYKNVGENDVGTYFGGATLAVGAADLIQVATGGDNGGTAVTINLPLGLQIQADPRFAVTLSAGYAAVVTIPSGSSSGSSITDHFIPVGVEAVFSATPSLDLGGAFSFDGFIKESGNSSSGGPGFFDLRSGQVFLRFRG